MNVFDSLNSWLEQYLPLMLVIGVVLVLVTLVIGFVLISRRPVLRETSISYDIDVNAIVREVMEGVEHAADVSAVLSLMKQLDADPDALELIKSYPQTVQAAAMIHLVNTLGNAMREANLAYGRTLKHYSFVSPSASNDRARIKGIQDELNAAVKASGQLGLRAVN